MSNRLLFISVVALVGLGSSMPVAAQPAPPAAPASYIDDLVSRADALLQAAGKDRNPGLAARLLAEATAAGNTNAMRRLAALLIKGDVGVRADPKRAEALLGQAIAAGAKSAYETLGDLYRADTPLKDAAKAVDAYQKAADVGSTSAMRKLAALLIKGEGSVLADPPRAAALIRQAISAGADPKSANESLGDLYRADTPLKDMARAVDAYQQAADAGNMSAAKKLAAILVKGDGVPPESARAEALLGKVVASGDVAGGQEALGDLYLADTPLKDPSKAVDAYQQSLRAGSVSAMRKLAAMYSRGDGVPFDPDRAQALLKQAIAAGDTIYAPESLGDLYFTATQPRAMGPAIDAYEQAVAGGNTNAMRKLASILMKGDGVAADPKQAEKLLTTAIAAGSISANDALGDLYQSNTPLRDPVKAVAAYQKAADAGNAGAARKLATILIKGDAGVPADPAAASAILRAAIAAGDTKWSTDLLGDLYRAETPLKDPAKAAELYQQAIDAGNTASIRKLAIMLVKGDGIPADPAKAESLIGQIVASGDTKGGQEAFGDLYSVDSPLKNPAKAAAAYQQAIDVGSTSAIGKLATMLAKGDGVAADLPRAEAMLSDVIRAGDNKNAPKQLGDLILAAAPNDPNARADALRNYELAAKNGNAGAHLAAAELLRPNIRRSNARNALVNHLKAAAALLSPEQVAKTMMRYPTTDLIYGVQELLEDAGIGKGADGALGRQTQLAMAKFCTTRKIGDCPTDFVGAGVLVTLLKEFSPTN